jgi:small subunit ribosomal protein S24e
MMYGEFNMNIEIINEKENLLLDRKEIAFEIIHSTATPSRDEVKNKLITLFNSHYDLVIVDKLKTEYGAQKTSGNAKVYSDAKRASQIENKYILERNKPKPVEEIAEEKPEEKGNEISEK